MSEVIAILEVIKIIINEEHSKYIILNDFLSILNNIQNKFNLGDIANKIQNKLEEALQKNKLKIFM